MKHEPFFNWSTATEANWTRIKNHCRTTVNKKFTDKVPNDIFKRKLLLSEHTPIRLLEFDWSWREIKSWIATHWSRHKFEKFISTQRDDRKDNPIPRDELPQGTLVDIDCYANAQQLIDAFRKRLCFQASPETREMAEDFKVAMYDICPELADLLVPNCFYRCGCPEFEPCGYFKAMMPDTIWDVDDLKDFTNIEKRYAIYNERFRKEAGLE